MSGRTRAASGLLALAVCVGALTGCGADGAEPAGSATMVRVAAAADLKFALDEIVGEAEDRDPSLEVSVTYGSSGTFLQQIQNGAPFDLYLSADLAYPRELVDAGAAEERDLFRYAVGRLVLWTPEGSPVDPRDGLSVLDDGEIGTVSIANPEHAPYGVAAVAALRDAGVWDAVEPKLVLGENVAQAAEFVQSGNADAAIVAKSLVLSDPLRDVGTWFELPLDSYPGLDQGGVVLAGASDRAAARELRDVLLGEVGTEVLARYGFTLPED